MVQSQRRALTPDPADSLCAAFQRTAERQPDALALATVTDGRRYSWREYAWEVRRAAQALHNLGVRAGDTVGIMLRNRPEFHVMDSAALHLGAIPVSIYNTLPADDVAWVLNDAGATVAISEEAFVPVLQEAARRGWKKSTLVSVDGVPCLADFATPTADHDLAATWRRVGPHDLATISYTSGTTGPPKGVEVTHRSVLGILASLNTALGSASSAQVVSYLPAAHLAERLIAHYPSMINGTTIWCCPDPAQVLEHIAVVKPTHLFSPPRLFEKIRSALEASVGTLSDIETRGATLRAVELGHRVVDLQRARRPVPDDLRAQYETARASYLTPLLVRAGLGGVRVAFAGAAPVNPDMMRYFLALGLPIRECWGMSEACGFVTFGATSPAQIGSVGPPVPGAEVRSLDDGELLLRSPWLMKRYHNRPELTAETIDPEGWLHTGDVGEIDADGTIRLTDRKKELIINSAGKNMSPATIEAKLKDAHPVIAHACVIGDSRPYNVALIVLDPSSTAHQATNADGGIEQLVESAVAQANSRMSRVEQIKRFVVLDETWLPGGAELSPTMKLRRASIATKYAEAIDALYAKPGAPFPRQVDGPGQGHTSVHPVSTL